MAVPSVEILEMEEETNREAKREFVEIVGFGKKERLVGHKREFAQCESWRRAFLLPPMAVRFGSSTYLRLHS